MTHSFCFDVCPLVLMLFAGAMPVDEPPPSEPATIERVHSVNIGIRIVAPASVNRYIAGTPLPTVWPEQTVELLNKKYVRCTGHERDLGGGRVLVVRTAMLTPGEEASAMHNYRVVTRSIPPIWRREDFTSPPSRYSADLASYRRPSPGIESDDPTIRALAKSLSDRLDNDWDRARAFYDWSFDKIEYREQRFTSASIAIAERTGDCEERAAVFIGLCRAAGIPARTVWSPGHCWAEFHLIDQMGRGHWIPAHTAGNRWFAELATANVILQKGDNFRVPESRLPPHRLLSSWTRGVEPKPAVEFIQEVRSVSTQPSGAQSDRPSARPAPPAEGNTGA